MENAVIDMSRNCEEVAIRSEPMSGRDFSWGHSCLTTPARARTLSPARAELDSDLIPSTEKSARMAE
jgi:hypothetical protein